MLLQELEQEDELKDRYENEEEIYKDGRKPRKFTRNEDKIYIDVRKPRKSISNEEVREMCQYLKHRHSEKSPNQSRLSSVE